MSTEAAAPPKRRSRWDVEAPSQPQSQPQSQPSQVVVASSAASDWETEAPPPAKRKSRWDLPPQPAKEEEENPSSIAPIVSSTEGTLPATGNVSAQLGNPDLPALKPSDAAYFTRLDDPVQMHLLRIKNGTTKERKSSMKSLLALAPSLGPAPILDTLLPLFMSPSLDEMDRHVLTKLLLRLIQLFHATLAPHTHRIIVVASPLLMDINAVTRQEGRNLISALSLRVGLVASISAIRSDMAMDDEQARNATARTLAVIVVTHGVRPAVPILNASVASPNVNIRLCALMAVGQVPLLMGPSVLTVLREMVQVLRPILASSSSNDASSSSYSSSSREIVNASNSVQVSVRERNMAAMAVANLAEAVQPYGIDAFEELVPPLLSLLTSARNKSFYLRALSAIVVLMDEEMRGIHLRVLERVITRELGASSYDEEAKRAALHSANTLSFSSDSINTAFVENVLVRRCMSHRGLVQEAVLYGSRVFSRDIIGRCGLCLRDEHVTLQKTALNILEGGIARHGIADVMVPVKLQVPSMSTEEGVDTSSVITVNVVTALEACFAESNAPDVAVYRLAGHLIRSPEQIQSMLATCKVRMASRDAGVRASAARMMEAVADNLVHHTLDKGQSNGDFTSQHDDVIDPLPMLEETIRWLGESLGEEFPDTLAAILSCMNALLRAIAKFSPDSSSDESSPSPALARLNQAWSSIFPRLVPILKNRNDAVLQYVLSVLSLLVSRAPAPRQELLRLAFDAVENLRSTLRPIRRAASACIGAIANTLGPHDVLAMLLANLRVQERSARVATTVALAAVAETCGAFTVLPALFTEYRTPELHVRTGVLKSMAFLAESLGPKIADYVDAMSTVVVDALTDRDLVHRQQACGVAKFLALGCVGKGKETVLLHILNHVWPNVLEQSPHVVEAVMGAVEGFALALGPGRIVQYTVQGLFHPARKVRDRFWTLWNLLLQGWADAMVASIPRIEAIESKWHVEELDLML